jgi:hypothetical protein
VTVAGSRAQLYRQPDEGALARCEGFLLRLADGSAGLVEEVWVGADRRPAALLVSLPRRRVVVTIDQVEAVDPERRQVELAAGAELVDRDAFGWTPTRSV